MSGTTTYYYYEGTRLIAEITNGDITAYMYDAYGSVMGFQYTDDSWNGAFWSTYLYGKNAQGDVVAVYDGQGVLRVSYAYNAWGYATVTYHGCDATSTAAKNPIRYRGYYYDKNLEMYYLQSRYYDPVLCRFISPDNLAYLGANGDFDGYNLYAYCSNNPVNFVDPTGCFGWGALLAITLSAVIIGGTSQLLSNYMAGHTGRNGEEA